jgi:hypothetical protein
VTRFSAGRVFGALLALPYLIGLIALASHVGIFDRLSHGFDRAQRQEQREDSREHRRVGKGRARPIGFAR